jgi:hypothetical protein
MGVVEDGDVLAGRLEAFHTQAQAAYDALA